MALEENNNPYDRLEELGGSKYETRDGEPDIKGWDVKTTQGEKVGEVDDLLFNPESRKVRYLIVDLEGNELHLDKVKKILIPIGIAELHARHFQNDDEDNDEDNAPDEIIGTDSKSTGYDVENDDADVVIVPITLQQLRGLPSYEKNKVTAETEITIRRVFEGPHVVEPVAYSKNQFYEHGHFDENKFYEKRPKHDIAPNVGNTEKDTTTLPVIEENMQVGKEEVSTGGMRTTNKIVERPVQEDITLRQERVTVVHNPVNRPLSADYINAFKDEEFEFIEHAEVPVITKEARVVEEVSLRKDVEERQETIYETLRKTEVIEERIDPEKRDLL